MQKIVTDLLTGNIKASMCTSLLMLLSLSIEPTTRSGPMVLLIYSYRVFTTSAGTENIEVGQIYVHVGEQQGREVINQFGSLCD